MDEKKRSVSSDDKNILDELIDKYARVLTDKNDKDVKIGDLIKLIELRLKLAPGDANKKELLQMLEKIRREKLPDEQKTNKKIKSPQKDKVFK